MSEDGSLPLESVIETLKAAGVAVSKRKDGAWLIVRGMTIQVQSFQARLSRPMIRELSRRFGVHIHLFYNPYMIVDAATSVVRPSEMSATEPKGRPS